jgi:hypothetical protein
MFHRSLYRISVFVAGFALTLGSLHAGAQQDDSGRGRKYKVPPPAARIEIVVLRDVNGKPVESAAVIFHPMEGERDKGAMELKTNEDGKAVIDVIPIGDTVRLQVIAHGFQTYGQDYKIDKASMTMEVRLKRPGEQYSIYKQHDETANSGKSSGGDQPAGSPKDSTPSTPPADPKSSGTPSKPESQPPPSQPQL